MCNSFSDIHSSIFDDEWHKWVEITSTVDVWLRHATAWPVGALTKIYKGLRVLRKVALNGNSSQNINHEDSRRTPESSLYSRCQMRIEIGENFENAIGLRGWKFWQFGKMPARDSRMKTEQLGRSRVFRWKYWVSKTGKSWENLWKRRNSRDFRVVAVSGVPWSTSPYSMGVFR